MRGSKVEVGRATWPEGHTLRTTRTAALEDHNDYSGSKVEAGRGNMGGRFMVVGFVAVVVGLLIMRLCV